MAAALKLKTHKTLTGVMKLLAKPRKARKGEDPTQIYWHNEPERLQALYEYNRNTDFAEKSFVRVDVTEEFPFLVTKLSPYYDR